MKKPRCPICGSYSPNVYGECLCSYELSMFQPHSKEREKALVRALKSFMKMAIKK